MGSEELPSILDRLELAGFIRQGAYGNIYLTRKGIEAVKPRKPAAETQAQQNGERSGYGVRRTTLDKIEMVMEYRRKAKRNGSRPTRKQAYNHATIDSKPVRKYAPAINNKWDDWESGWEDDWRQIVGWEALERTAN